MKISCCRLVTGLLVVIAVLCVFTPIRLAAASEVTLKVGAGSPPPWPGAIAIQLFKEVVERETHGRVDVVAFLGNVGTLPDIAQKVQFGGLDMGFVTIYSFRGLVPEVDMLDLPFVVPDLRTANRLLSSSFLEEHVWQRFPAKGIVVTYPVADSMRGIAVRGDRSVKNPQDLKGLKVRVAESPLFIESYKAWGANPTVIPWNSMYTSIQQGMIDGLDTALEYSITGKFYEVAKNHVVIGQQPVTWAYFWNKNKLDGLNPALRSVILDALHRVRDWLADYTRTAQVMYEAQLIQLGAKVYHPTSAEHLAWVNATIPVRAQFYGKFGKTTVDELYRLGSEEAAKVRKEYGASVFMKE